MSTESPRIPEKIYEDWLVENLDVFGAGARLAARQFSLPSGRVPDLLVLTCTGLTVVEVKACRATPAAVLQLLGYMGEFLIDMKRTLPVEGVLAAPDISGDALLALKGAGCDFLRLSADISAAWHDRRLDGRSNGVMWDALRHGIPGDMRPSVKNLVGPAMHVAFKPILWTPLPETEGSDA